MWQIIPALALLGLTPQPTLAAAPTPDLDPSLLLGSAVQEEDSEDPLEHLQHHSRVTPVVEVYQAVSPSVVFIQIEGTRRVRSIIGNRARLQRSSGSGTGVVIHEEGYLVTNYHVVRDADPGRIQVSFVDDPLPYRAELLSFREHEDLALLRITGSMEPFAPTPNRPAALAGEAGQDPSNLKRDRGRQKFPTVRMGTSADLMPGERVVAIGNPHGQTHTVSEGIISGLHRDVRVDGGGGYALNFSNLIQTDASINLGNSGGPLLNVNGELIGINTVMNTAAENIGYAIPVDRVREVLTQQLFPSAQNAWLGYEVEVGPELRVSKVWPGSPAELAGICAGDQVLRVAGRDVHDEATLLNANLLVQPYRNTEVLIESSSKGRISKQLTPWDRVSGILYENLGVTTREVAGARQSLVLVDKLRPDSPATELGLQSGDWLWGAKFPVDRRGYRSLQIGSRDDLLRLVGALPAGTQLEFEIFRDLNEDEVFTTDERHRGKLRLP